MAERPTNTKAIARAVAEELETRGIDVRGSFLLDIDAARNALAQADDVLRRLSKAIVASAEKRSWDGHATFDDHA